MDSNNQVSVGSLLQSVAQTLKQNQAGLNSTGAQQNSSHGDRMAQAFQAAAQAAQRAHTQDAGQQFEVAAQALRQNGQGKAVQYYSNGLQAAAKQFSGKQGLTSSDLGPLLQSLAGGAQQGNPAQPGQGTMLDALLPAAQSFNTAQSSGLDEQQAALHAIAGAASGAQHTVKITGNSTGQAGFMDPGAASATNVIGGIVSALLPGLLSSFLGGGQSSQAQAQSPLGGLGGLLGGSSGGNDPLGGLGGLLGALGGGSGGGLGALGGLLGGGQQTQQAPQTQQHQKQTQDESGGLGGLLGGLFGGGNDQEEKPSSGTNYV